MDTTTAACAQCWARTGRRPRRISSDLEGAVADYTVCIEHEYELAQSYYGLDEAEALEPAA